MIVTFDFDNTLTQVQFDPDDGCFSKPAGPNLVMVQCLQAHLKNGNEVHIVTSRHENDRSINEINGFLIEHMLHEVASVRFTNGALKADCLHSLNSSRHHDDDHVELDNLPPDCEGIFIPTGWLDEHGTVCDPDDPHFHFDNWFPSHNVD